MSLSNLLPLVNDLNNSDKLALLKLLAAQVPDAELQMIFSAQDYPIYTPYNCTEAADVLMQMIKDDQQKSAHA